MGYLTTKVCFSEKLCWVKYIKEFDTGRGLIVGQQHIVTFDGQAKAISTDCSYLLAKDFIDSLFSVQIQYNKAGNNIIIEYNGKRVTMTVDGKVSIENDNRKSASYNINFLTGACGRQASRSTFPNNRRK